MSLQDAPPLEARSLSRKRNGNAILERIDLTVSSGEIVSLLGANGSGKTTLLHCLAGRLRPCTGDVLWFGVSPLRRPASHSQVGLAAHETFLYPELTARENLLFAARMYGVIAPEQRVADLLSLSQLESHAERAAGRLSKGMRQRLSLARALIHAPPIVILDEPFTGLDSASREWLERWLGELREQRHAVCFTSHDEEQSRRVADRRFKLRGGGLIPVPQRSLTLRIERPDSDRRATRAGSA
jgi:heme ABC exporter ATP-binding subunit CcmA